MRMMKDQPGIHSNGFDCPTCGKYAHQRWAEMQTGVTRETRQGESGVLQPTPMGDKHEAIYDEVWVDKVANGRTDNPQRACTSTGRIGNGWIAQCQACGKLSIWIAGRRVWPPGSGGQAANTDMPDDAKVMYREAQQVSGISPRAGAALARRALEVVLENAEGWDKKKTLDKNIEAARQRGLPQEIIDAMDIVRVTGNEALHGGKIAFDDPEENGSERTATLLWLINIVATELYSKPREVRELWDALPENKKEGIIARNRKGGS